MLRRNTGGAGVAPQSGWKAEAGQAPRKQPPWLSLQGCEHGDSVLEMVSPREKPQEGI